jgi:hypothetical protein
MDATAELALMTKAKLVFERPGTFLSFPALAPITFPTAVLDFGKAVTDPKVSAALLDFSRLVNQCPTGPIHQADNDQYLWDQYDHWLNGMVLARPNLSEDQEADYQRAYALLNTTDANGFTIDSASRTVYKQYRDKYISAEQAYKSAQSTAEMSQDAAVKTRWHDTDEPQLRQSVAAAMEDWEEKGNKTNIETAQNTVASFEARMPGKIQLEWRKAFNPDLDLLTDAASNATYGPSGFSPSNLFTQPWTTFTLSSDEIHGLAAKAPSELQALFGKTEASKIASISFEFCSAAVVRPWFNSAIFSSRFWKFSDGQPGLSDGNVPPNGAWPAYVVAVVFARNIKVTDAVPPTQPAPHPPPVSHRPPVVVHRHPPPVDHGHPSVHRPAPPHPPHPPPVNQGHPSVVHRPAQPHAPHPPPVDHRHPSVLFRPTLFKTMPQTAPSVGPAARPAMAMAPMRVSTVGSPVPPLRPAAAHTVAPTITPAHPPVAVINPAVRLDGALYRVVPPGQSSTQPSHVASDVTILAFICQSLPKVPNPDPTLTW